MVERCITESTVFIANYISHEMGSKTRIVLLCTSQIFYHESSQVARKDIYMLNTNACVLHHKNSVHSF